VIILVADQRRFRTQEHPATVRLAREHNDPNVLALGPAARAVRRAGWLGAEVVPNVASSGKFSSDRTIAVRDRHLAREAEPDALAKGMDHGYGRSSRVFGGRAAA
jgi:hypothetical protein